MEKKVLVAEDDRAIRRSVEFALKKAGYVVVTAENGEEALALAVSERPDLLLLDLIMPRLNGFETLRRLKARPDTRDLRVIVFSNLSQEADLQAALALGAVDFLVKSDLSIEALLDRVRRHLAEAA